MKIQEVTRTKATKQIPVGPERIALRSRREFDKAIGRRLRMARIRADKSQTDVGNALGIAFQQVQKYENGANRISCGRLVDCANYLDIPIAYFFEGLGKQSSPIRKEATEAVLLEAVENNKRLIMIVEAAKSLDKNLQMHILHLIEEVGKKTKT